jgi:DNA-binding transcriptional MerR regulator
MENDQTGKGLFSVSDFAKFSRTTKDTLLHYDRIGLLSPASRGENKYRYYSSGQLAVVNVIRTFQELGMSLSDIKDMKERRTPENIYEVLMHQIEKIDMKIEDWVRAKKLLHTFRSSIRSALEVNEEVVTVQFLPAEAIILGGLNDYSRDQKDYDALLRFYNSMSEKYPDLELNYPVWGFFTEERIKRGDWVWPDRYYFYNPEGHDKRPAALYAIGYTRGGYGQCGELYKRIFEYIDQNGFEICGGAYEEYPLNEVCVADEKKYLIRVMVTVREKG